MGFFKALGITLLAFMAGMILVVAITLAGVHMPFDVEPQYKVGETFEFEFYNDDTVEITILSANFIGDRLLLHVMITNIDVEYDYLDSPYQFIVKDQTGNILPPVIRDYKGFKIDEIKIGESIITIIDYDIVNPNEKHVLGIKEYIGGRVIGVELS